MVLLRIYANPEIMPDIHGQFYPKMTRTSVTGILVSGFPLGQLLLREIPKARGQSSARGHAIVPIAPFRTARRAISDKPTHKHSPLTDSKHLLSHWRCVSVYRMYHTLRRLRYATYYSIFAIYFIFPHAPVYSPFLLGAFPAQSATMSKIAFVTRP